MHAYDLQTQQWRYVLEITRAIAARLDLNEVLNRALRYAVELVGGDAGLLALRAPEGDTFHFASRYGIEAELLPRFETLLTEIPLSIAQEGFPRWRFPTLALKFAGVIQAPLLRFQQAMAIPLIAADRLIGVIYVFRPPRAAAFTLMDQDALEGFADHVAIAIEHARLYQDATQRAQELDAVIEGSANGFLIANREGKLQRTNLAFEQWTGWTRQELLGKSIYEVLRWKDARGQENRPPPFSDNSRSFASDGYLVRRDGSNGAFVHITLAPLFDQNRQLFSIVGTVVDVTALQEANELQKAFLAGISHDLKTPLALIRGYAETLRRPDVTWDRETIDTSLRIIQEEAEYLTRLVNALLDAAQLERGRLPLQISLTRIDESARTLVERFQAVHPDRRWQLEFPADFPAVPADAERLRQVLQNLLSNAVKYTPAGSTITVGGWSEPERIGVFVRDEGPGLPPEEQARLFGRFARGRAHQTRRSEGAGLGLYLCRSIIEQHGGRIWMENLPERGAVFYFTLPRPKEEA